MVQVQTYLHHPTYGQTRSISATTKQDNAKPEYQHAGFGCAKAFFKVLAYILSILSIMFLSFLIYNMECALA